MPAPGGRGMRSNTNLRPARLLIMMTLPGKTKAKTKMTTSDGNSVRKEEPLHALEGGCQLVQVVWRAQELKRELPEESAISLLGLHLKGSKRDIHTHFYCCPIHNS